MKLFKDSDRVLQAIFSNAIYTYEFDVTTGIVENDIIGVDGTNFSKMMGFSAPYNFDDQANMLSLQKINTNIVFLEDQIGIISRQMLLDAFAAGQKRLESVVYSKDKKSYFKLAYFLWQNEEDGHIWALSFCEDLANTAQDKLYRTTAEALKAADAANKAKTIFLNNMSHDIRTPMNAIIGFTSLASTHLDDKEILKDYLKKITTSSTHLLSLINDVLDMSRIESGRVRLEEQPCHLPTIMHDLRNVLQTDINAKRLHFLIDTVDVVDEDIICDKLRLNQVLLNCISNAVKFTPPGGTVGVRIIQTPGAPEGYANIDFVVHDTGIGMSEEFVKHIFEPFTREETSTISGIQGTGLGMSITKNIVEMMGGKIEVQSEQGKGSKFTVSLTFKLSGEKHQIKVIKSLEGMKALVADDNMDTCFSVGRMLESIGMHPEWTMSGVEAVYKAKYAFDGGRPYKAFIIDWLMPDMNGVEVVRRIRQNIGEDTPIIILTAYDWSDIEKEAKAAGVTAFCAKPLFLSDLYDVLSASIADVREEGVEEKEKQQVYADKKLLLVEDNELNREIARAMLSSTGINIEEAENGREALEIMQSSHEGYFDLILMDIQMPIMDGYTATKEIRKLERKDAREIPIVAVSANAFEEDRQKSLEVGMNDHLAKPFDQHKLEAVLKKYLE